MQKELEDLQPKLVTAQEENAKMMVVIEKENVEVEARSKVVRKDEEAANVKAACVCVYVHMCVWGWAGGRVCALNGIQQFTCTM